jgi:hypothetical protein
MLWNLWSRGASPEATTSARPWRDWLYRALGTDEEQAASDFCGVVDAAARNGRLPAEQADALRLLYKRFMGPGEIEQEHADAARRAFTDRVDRTALDLLLLYDRITSQERPVGDHEIARGLELAEHAGARGLVAFLLLQLGARALAAEDINGALEKAEHALHVLSPLVREDPAFQARFDLAAAFLYSVVARTGDRTLILQVRSEYGENIDAYLARQAED